MCILQAEWKYWCFFHTEKSLCLQTKVLDQNHPLWISSNKKHHAKGCRFLIFSRSLFPELITRGVFWSKCAFYRQNGKTDAFFTPKKVYAHKRRLWTKTTPFGLVRVKNIMQKGVDFKIFDHSHFLEPIPRGWFGLNLDFTGKMETWLQVFPKIHKCSSLGTKSIWCFITDHHRNLALKSIW